MAWMESDYKSLKRYALSMEDKMAAGAFGRAKNYGRDGPLHICMWCSSKATMKAKMENIQNRRIRRYTYSITGQSQSER